MLGKRIFDLCISALCLFVLLPVMAVIAILVRFSSSGPIIFSQVRIGLEGGPFVIYKFRTMKDRSGRGGIDLVSKNDPRVTPIGRILRQTRLDELPQLWNVLRGEMSLVGPRPHTPAIESAISNSLPLYSERRRVKPGMTGLAQVESRCDHRSRARYDVFYIRKASIFLDLWVLSRTPKVMFERRGV